MARYMGILGTIIFIVLFKFSKGELEQPTSVQGEKWAVLVAGSNGYENYRHQADVCHAYHILREHGIPAENIITMMYDDIAFNKENPQPGVVINAINGTNLYEGVVRDYIGDDVNSTNFLKVLIGDEGGMKGIGSGKVLKSGPNDTVFINFVDHGANGLICFPNYTDVLYAPDLLKAFMQMSDKGMYKKMLVYIEACESGSLFDKFLSEHLNIFAVTAAKRNEDSYACCWDDTVRAFLGDVFSVNWMDDSDFENLRRETVARQFSIVVEETNTSHPQEFGTPSVSLMHVGEFMGMTYFQKNSVKVSSQCQDAVRSPDVPVAVLQRQLEMAETHAARSILGSRIKQLFKLRRSVDHAIKDILLMVYGSSKQQQMHRMLESRHELLKNDYNCYKKLTNHWFSHCYGHSTSPYALQKLPTFANICFEEPDLADTVIHAMDVICSRIEVRKGIK